MTKFIVAYLVVAIVFLVIDYIWLGYVMKDYFQTQLAHLMADEVNMGVAALFYLFFAAGVVLFCVHPALEANSMSKAALYGAFFGFLAYGTYDVTNMATLKDWPVMMSVIDVSWGTALTGLCATASYWVTNHFYPS